MKKSHLRLVQIGSVLTLPVAIGWLLFQPGFEPVLAILTSMTAIVSTLFIRPEENDKDKPLPLSDECEFAAEIQLDVLSVGGAEIGGGGITNFWDDYVPKNDGRRVYFGGRHDEMAELDAWLTQTEKRFGFLVAPAGMGKSALVANWAKRLQDSGQAVVVYHPISIRYGTNSQKQTLRSLLEQMSEAARKEAALESDQSYMSGLDLIDKFFNKEELQEVCFHLSVDYDNLGEGGKRNRAQELIRRCQRNGRLDELVVLCRKMRPHHDWDAAFARSTLDRLLYEPPQEGDDEQLLIEQLQKNLRQSTGWNKPLVVVIDGLDELANQLNQPEIKPVGFLPNQVGEGIYVLAVARGESNDVRDEWERALGWGKSPVLPFTLRTLQKKDIRDMVSQSRSGVESGFLAPLADRIYELSEEGDPLIASLWLDWLAEQADREVSSLLEDLEGQSPGINTYIDGVLSQINPLVSEAAKPLFEVLSLARGPLTAGDLYALGIKIDSGQLNRLVNLSGRLIIKTESAYVISHSRIRQAIQDKFVSPSSERREYWLEQFHRYGRCSLRQASKMPDGKISTYILNYYAEHLFIDKPADYVPSLYALVDKAWKEAHYDRSGSYDGFLMDVDRALATATETGMKQLANGQSIDQLSLEIKGLMCHASITSLSSNLSPNLPALLVRDGIWNPRQAVSHVLRVADVAQRTRALVTLLTVEESEQVFSLPENQNLRDVIISSGLRDMQLLWQQNKVDEAELYHLQLAISPFLSAIHVDEALLLAGKVQRSVWQARLLAELMPLIEDKGQQIQTIKKIIYACSKIQACSQIDDLSNSKDAPFIVPTYTSIAQNLPMDQLAATFSAVWEEETQTIKAHEQVIKQSQNDSSVDPRDWQSLQRKASELNENRARKKRIFDYLAWHIDTEKAPEFVDILFKYETLPEVAEKIVRFARRLDDETAYNITVQLEEQFALAPREKRECQLGIVSKVEGIGIGFIALAFSRKGAYQQRILEITDKYIQTFGEKDTPYREQDLRTLYKLVTGELSDTQAAVLIKQGEFLRRFWYESYDGASSDRFSMFSQELVVHLEAETVESLFERWMQSESEPAWSTGGSLYVLPSLAEKLLDRVYKIGYGMGENGRYYYADVRAVSKYMKQLPEAERFNTIKWALHSMSSTDFGIRKNIAQFIKPSMIPDKYLRKKISADMAERLLKPTLRYIVNHFVSDYGKDNETDKYLQFVKCLPDKAERAPILKGMEAELFQIKDNGELSRTIKTLERQVPFSARREIRRLSRKVRSEMTNSYLLTSEHFPLEPLFMLIPGPRFSHYGIGVFEAQRSLFEFSARQIGLLRFNELSHQLTQKWQAKIQKRSVDPLYSADMNSWLGKLLYRITHLLASSKFIWILYLLCIFVVTFSLLIISSIIILLLLPLVVLVAGGQLLLIPIKLGIDWLKHHFGKRKLGSSLNIFEMNASLSEQYGKRSPKIKEDIKEQIQTLNQISEPREREQVFVDIAHAIENNWRIHNIDIYFYRDYASNARDIWSELESKFVSDALSVLTNYHGYRHSIDSVDFYIRAIMPAVALKNKSLLPKLNGHIENPYRQREAFQYACLAYFLEGQERLDVLKKSVAAFPYAEFSNTPIEVLTEVADYATPDLIPHLLHWLLDYPVALALEKLACKIVQNDDWLEQGFTIAQKIDDSVHEFICNIAPHLNRKWITKAVVFVLGRDFAKEQEKCMPALVERWSKLSPQEIYAVWQEVFKVMQGYPRSRVLTQLSWFSDVFMRLAGTDHIVDVLKEVLTVWSWWDVVWQKPAKRLAKPYM